MSTQPLHRSRHLVRQAFHWPAIAHGNAPAITRSRPVRSLRPLLALLLCVLSNVNGVADMKQWRTFLETHCLTCHNSEHHEAGLRLDTLSTDLSQIENVQVWVKVHDQLHNNVMPPQDSSQPAPEVRQQLLQSLHQELSAASDLRRQADGRSIVRRLNRKEYENALRDLFDLSGLEVRDLLPEDGEAFGFDKSGNGLDISYVQMARYLEAADAALDMAIAPHTDPPVYQRAHIPAGASQALFAQAFRGNTVFLRNFEYDSSLIPIPEGLVAGKDERLQRMRRENAKVAYDGSIGVLIPEGVGAFKPRFPFRVVYPGRYRIRMSLWSFLWDKGEVKPAPRTESALLSVSGRTLGYFDAPSLQPAVTEIEVWLNPMRTPRDEILFNAVTLKSAGPNNGNLASYTGPGIAIDWLDVEGPLLDSWPPLGHRRLFSDLQMAPLPPTPRQRGPLPHAPQPAGGDLHNPIRPADNAFVISGNARLYLEDFESLPKKFEYSTVVTDSPVTDAERLLTDFLPRAFRRPVSATEAARYVELARTRLEAGDTFEVAMRMAFKAALCSPEFLYLQNPPGPLDAWSMAERLSFFLWNSVPDDELTRLAAEDRLRNPDVLRAQVERLLNDPRSERFVIDFTNQWLDLDEIDATTPDRRLYPEFRQNLRDAMLAEPHAFFRELVDKDLPAASIVDSSFAMLNQRLAEHYGIPDVHGSAIRRVSLPADSHRGGFITQAGVLKVTANGTTTSPVKRGAWMMKKIVGRPPGPPPGDVPAIEPDLTGTTTIREMLAAHRDNQACAGCHALIDPPGFALENYDVIGGWQQRYRSLDENGIPVQPSETWTGRRVGYTWGPEVDASGVLADGRTFQNLVEYRQLLLQDRRALAENLLSQLTVYATGTPIEFADRADREQLLSKVAAGDFGVRALIHALVQSPLFQLQ